ncbi:MAG: hypothetical protein K940chlam2_00981 [Chlamydiae bacterium]|nr:hypothetical protein [Chlamydiota bacterium]
MKKLFIVSVCCFVSLMRFACSYELPIIEESLTCQIEIQIQKPVYETFQVMVFLHGAQDLGLRSIHPAVFEHWLEKGYAVAAISMPGYGNSTGERDFSGPNTLDALHISIDRIKEELAVPKLGMIGFGQGGLAATLLSAQRGDIACVVSSNGGYDLLRHNASDDILRSILENKKYQLDLTSEEDLIVRSPLYHVSEMSAPLFLLHRKGNPIVSEQEAVDFHDAMLAAGKECFLVIKDKTPTDDEQQLSFEEILIEAESWIDEQMGRG